MANINEQIQAIGTAIYGEEVRGAIVQSLTALDASLNTISNYHKNWLIDVNAFTSQTNSISIDTTNKKVTLAKGHYFGETKYYTISSAVEGSFAEILEANASGITFYIVYDGSAISFVNVKDALTENALIIAQIYFDGTSLKSVHCRYKMYDYIYVDGILHNKIVHTSDLTEIKKSLRHQLMSTTSAGINIDVTNKIITVGKGTFFGKEFWVSVTSDLTLDYTNVVGNGATFMLTLSTNGKTLQLVKQNTVAITNRDMIIATIYLFPAKVQQIFCEQDVKKLITVNGEAWFKEAKSVTNDNTCSIFRRVCCVGDSFTSGHITKGATTIITNEGYAWASFMARATGNEYVNCGASGANVWTWQTAERGLAKAQATGKVQAYIIGLGLNDTSDSSRAIELGTIDDVGTENETYYAGLSKIIRELKAISSDAMVFVQTMAKPTELQKTYNNAIREIVAMYADTYSTHLLDLEAYSDWYEDSSLTSDFVGGHYTAIGYQQFAEILRRIWSEYINANINKFQNVHLISYDES